MLIILPGKERVPMIPEIVFLWFQKLGIMGYPLTLSSIFMIILAIDRTVFSFNAYRTQGINTKKLLDRLTEYQLHPKAIRDEKLMILLDQQKDLSYEGMQGLKIIATVSPIMGFLGTILGIIEAFKLISLQTEPVSPNIIAEGLWEAMLTTAFGLFIALPTLLLYHLFSYIHEKQLKNICFQLNELSFSFELQKKNIPPAKHDDCAP